MDGLIGNGHWKVGGGIHMEGERFNVLVGKVLLYRLRVSGNHGRELREAAASSSAHGGYWLSAVVNGNIVP